jgi:hypothetical protein
VLVNKPVCSGLDVSLVRRFEGNAVAHVGVSTQQVITLDHPLSSRFEYNNSIGMGQDG